VFLAKTGFGPADLAGRLVLDAGCGSGRYAAVAASLGPQVAAVDVTMAVERARETCAPLPDVQVVQADLLRLPFTPGRRSTRSIRSVSCTTRRTRGRRSRRWCES
jgi:SAM-dependent methyltransferase